MKKGEIALLVLACALTFVLVYTPHFSYSLPLHVDEWHHITEAQKLGEGEYSSGVHAYRLGFHVFLYLLSFAADLVKIYQFLPAIWAVITALTLFFVVRKKTGKFSIAFFSVIFFASIKSNVNLTGLWFFTPLSFSLPFIILFLYFFSEGMLHKNRKYILTSMALMLILTFVHPISVLFALPILLIYSAFHYKFVQKQWKFFSLFLLLGAIGFIFYTQVTNLAFRDSITSLLQALQFKYGWGILELDNSFTEVYSMVGYVLAAIGFIFLALSKDHRKKYLLYLIWPAVMLVAILIYKAAGTSYFSPYQRNIYYFALSLPLLSAYGLSFCIGMLHKATQKSILSNYWREYFREALTILLIVIVLFFTFVSYNSLSEDVRVYYLVSHQERSALEFLASQPQGKVMANLPLSTTVYPLTGHDPVGTLYFYGSRETVERFFAGGCIEKSKIISENNVSYVITKEKMDCGWNRIYDNDIFIYKK